MRRTILETLVLAMIALAAAALLNGTRRNPIPMRLDEAFYKIESNARPIGLRGALGLFEEGRAIFLDARSRESFALGQIDGALNVPADRWADLIDDVLPWIEGQKVVVYADEIAIDPADDLAGAILARGFSSDSLFVYIGGFEAWRAAGHPVREGASTVLDAAEDPEYSGEAEPETLR